MAITWGAAVTGGSGGMKLGYEVSRSGATLTVYIYVNTKYSVDDTSNTFIVSLTGGTGYNGAVTIKTTSNSGGWSDTNTKLLGTFTTSSAGTISISASLTGINTLGSSLTATLYASVVNYVDVSGGSVTIVDNGNNTATISGRSASSNSNNAISSAKLYWHIGHWNEETVAWGPDTNFSKTISIPSGCSQIRADLYSYGRVNTASVSATSSVKYYGNPGNPGKPTLSYRRKGPTLKEALSFNWAAASAGTNVPIVGYRLRLYKNGSLITGVNPYDASASYYDTNSTSTTYSFNASALGFKVRDKIKLGIYSYGKNGAGDLLFNGGGTAEAQVNSIEYTFINAGIIRIKKDGVWKEGQVYIKVNGVWKEADSVYIKKDGVWKESI